MASRTRAPAPTSASSRRGSASHRTAVRADPHAGRPRQGTRRGGRRRRGVARAEAPVVNRDQAIATRPGGAPLGRADAAAAPGPLGPVDDHLPDAQACSTSRPRSGGEEELRPGVSRLPSTSRTGSVRRVPREGQHPAVRSTPGRGGGAALLVIRREPRNAFRRIFHSGPFHRTARALCRSVTELSGQSWTASATTRQRSGRPQLTRAPAPSCWPAGSPEPAPQRAAWAG